jgi:cytoskeletal protein CcmA (bactofilin family)
MVGSRLEVQGTARIEGEVHARRVQLEEGAVMNGDIRMGDIDVGPPPATDVVPGTGGSRERNALPDGRGNAALL